MSGRDPVPLPRRIERALERAEESGISIRGISRELESRFPPGTEGISHSAIIRLRDGVTKASRPEVLREIGEVVGLLPEWMVTGRGPATAIEAGREAAGEARLDGEAGSEWFRIEEILDTIPAFRTWSQDARDGIVWTVLRLLEAWGVSLDSPEVGERARDIVAGVAWLLILPLLALRPGKPLSPMRSEMYVLAMRQVMGTALPDRGDGDMAKTLAYLRRLRKMVGDDRVTASPDPPRDATPTREIPLPGSGASLDDGEGRSGS